MSASLVVLEQFDAGVVNRVRAKATAAVESIREQRLRAEAFAEGHAAGQAAAAARADERARLAASVAAAIDAEIDRSAQKIAQEAGIAVKTILERIFPTIARDGFAIEVAAAIAKTAENVEKRVLEIAVPADKVEALTHELKKHTLNATISVKADPTLEGAVARATWTGGGLDLDFDRAARECLAVFESALNEFGSEKQS